MNLTKRTKIGIATGVLVLAAGAGTAAAATGGDGDGAQVITGPAGDQARAAAVTAVPGGQPGEVRGESDNATYGVDVARPDGSRVEVHLDGANRVLGTQPAGPGTDGDTGSEGAGNDGDGG